MLRARKKLLGIIGLLLVALMTVFAYFLPSGNAYAIGAGTDTIEVTVHGETPNPSIEITSPSTDTLTTSSTFKTTFSFENTAYVEFWLEYEDEEGNPQSLQLPPYNPNGGSIDPYASYTNVGSSTFNLSDHGLSYNEYILTAKSITHVGYDEDSIVFYYIPAVLEQTGVDKETDDPTIEVRYDNGVGKIEIMPVDEEGNGLFEEPIVIIIEPNEEGDYEAGTKTVTLPFTSYGAESGKYDVILTAYSATENGEEIDYDVIDSPISVFEVEYERPSSPSVPDTGVFSGGTSVAKSDLVATSIIIFVSVLVLLFVTVLRPRKKNYRKNIRSQK